MRLTLEPKKNAQKSEHIEINLNLDLQQESWKNELLTALIVNDEAQIKKLMKHPKSKIMVKKILADFQSAMDAALKLEDAIKKMDVECVQSLLEKGVDPNASYSKGYTPLKVACQYSHPDEVTSKIVGLLLKHGAKVDLKESAPLVDVKEQHHSESHSRSHTQSQRPASSEIKNENFFYEIPFDKKSKQKAEDQLDSKQIAEMTPLMLAVYTHLCQNKPLTNTIKLLLEHKADPNIKYSDGCSMLSKIIDPSQDADLTKLMLEHKANPNLDNDDGTTPLFLASKRMYRLSIIWAHTKKIDFDAVEDYLASLKIVNLLLEHDANPFQFTELSAPELIWEGKAFDTDFNFNIDIVIDPIFRRKPSKIFTFFRDILVNVNADKIAEKGYDHSLAWNFWEWMQKATIDANTPGKITPKSLIYDLEKMQKSIINYYGLKQISEAFFSFLMKHPNSVQQESSNNPEFCKATDIFLKNILSVLKMRGYSKDYPFEDDTGVLLEFFDFIVSKIDGGEWGNRFLHDNVLAVRGQIYYKWGRREEAVNDWMRINDLDNIPKNTCVEIGEGICNRAKTGNVQNYTQLMTTGLQFLKQAGSEVPASLLKFYVLDDEKELQKIFELDKVMEMNAESKDQKAKAKKDSEEKLKFASDQKGLALKKSGQGGATDIAISLDEEDETASREEQEPGIYDLKPIKAPKISSALEAWHKRIDAKIKMLSYGWDPLINAMNLFADCIVKNKPRFSLLSGKDYENYKPIYDKLDAIFKEWQVWGLDKEQAIIKLQAMKDLIPKLQYKASLFSSSFSENCSKVLKVIDQAIDEVLKNIRLITIHQVKDKRQLESVAEQKDKPTLDGSVVSAASVATAQVSQESGALSAAQVILPDAITPSAFASPPLTETPAASVTTASTTIFVDPQKIQAKKAAVAAALARTAALKESEHTTTASSSV